VRIVATPNRDLAEMVRRGEFRSDLYYRLHVFPILLPPLRERPEDLGPLAARPLAEAARGLGRPAPALAEPTLELLRGHPFPGNVRELRNALERAVVRCRGPVLEPRHLSIGPLGGSAHLPFGAAAVPRGASRHAAGVAPPRDVAPAQPFPPHLPLDLAQLERLATAEALRRVNGNRTHAARLLGIGLRTLRNKLKVYREEGAPLTPDDTADDADRPDRPCEVSSHARGSAELGASLRARSSQRERA
jgi:DNA-binding NtrC family response regulator